MAQCMLLVAALVVGQPGREAKEATYKIVDSYSYTGANSVVAQKEKDRTVFVVTSESGIGGAYHVEPSLNTPESAPTQPKDGGRTQSPTRRWP